MKNARALSHIRQLCCLRVDSHAVMPALMEALHDLIPSSNNLFIWTDNEGNPIDRYCEVYLPAVMEASRQNLPGKTDLKGIVMSGKPVGNLRERPPEFYRSPHFFEVYGPMRARHSLDAVVRTPRGTAGVLILHRDSLTPFSVDEEAEIETLLPYLRHLFSHPPSDHAQVFGECQSQATVVCDAAGQIQHISENAAQLLAMAQEQGILGPCDGTLQLPPELQDVCRRLAVPRPLSAPPVLMSSNRWGRFIFRATWLDGVTAPQDRLIALSITRQEPLAVSVVRGFQKSPLSPKQRDVALMLVTGRSAEDILKELSISMTTYKDHLRNIYEKLGVSRRVDLIRQLTQSSPIF